MSDDIERIVRVAREWIGTPYRHQASTLGAGCDCLGLLRGVWRSVIGMEPIKLPPYKADWRDRTHVSTLIEAAETYLLPTNGPPVTGDVVLFKMLRTRPPKHCGIMVGDTAFVHAQEQIGVVEANLTPAWRQRIVGTYHFPIAG